MNQFLEIFEDALKLENGCTYVLRCKRNISHREMQAIQKSMQDAYEKLGVKFIIVDHDFEIQRAKND